MQEITESIYIEDQFHGVTLGVIITPRGLIQIDAPPSPEDGVTLEGRAKQEIKRG
jgi:hypothetical protein